ncbi:MAG: OFA family MFS transporter [Armatimonadetes bacterium]|nr:OFA family MFS transporter [Armatimonadota bacterium]
MSEAIAAEARAPRANPADRWLVLAGALMVQCVLGTVYGFSALVKPIEAQFQWSATAIQGAFTVALRTSSAGMIGAGRLQDKLGPRLPALVGAVLVFGGLALASTITDAAQRWLWLVSYGVLFGAALGFAYVCPIAALAKWFPDIKGLITGIAVAGFGGGAAVFAPWVTKYMAVPGHTLQGLFLVYAVVGGVVVAVGALLLRNPPAGWVPPHATGPARAAAAGSELRQWEPGEIIGTGRFWVLWLMFVGSAAAGLMTIGAAKGAVKTAPGITEAQAALAVSVLALFNALGRVAWGGLSDRIGRNLAMTQMFAIQAVTMFAATTLLNLGAAPAYLLMALVGLNFGGNFALFPSATADAFGTRNLGINYGLVFTAYGIGGVVGPMAGAWFKDAGCGPGPAFLLCGVLVGAAAVGSALSVRRKAV